MSLILRVGTRGSQLAVTQTQQILDSIAKLRPEARFELEKITTKGDLQVTQGFAAIGAKGLFVKELDDALLSNRVDFAVHSLKDVPSVLEKGLTLAAVTTCMDPRDALIGRGGLNLQALPKGAKVGTSSLRRTVLVKRARPDLVVEGLRGNLDTRLRKLDMGNYDAIVVAAAGLKRMGFGDRVTEFLDPEEFIPAMGQGRLALVCREADENAREVLASVNDSLGHFLASVERIFVARMEGGCQVPMGCHAEGDGRTFRFSAFLTDGEGRQEIRRRREGIWDDAKAMAESLAEEILSAGGREILQGLRREV